MPFIPNNTLAIRNLANDVTSVIDPVIIDWDGPYGIGVAASVDDTYTTDYHNSAFNNSGTREEMLTAWLTHESQGIMWGVRGARYVDYEFRLGEGGGDEYGSLGLNHILFTYVYGQDRVNCEHLDAFRTGATTTQYDPKESARNLIKFVSYRDANCAGNGVHYLDKAINDSAWQVNYNNSSANVKVHGACTDGTVNGSCATTNWVYAVDRNTDFPWSEYDQIAKRKDALKTHVINCFSK